MFLLRFVGGRPANVLLGDGAAAASVLGSAGAALARLHLTPPPPDFRRYAAGVGTKDGMFSPATIAELRAHPEPEVAQHPFLDFFGARIGALQALVGGEAGLEEGLMHCDFFLDNLLLHVRPTTFVAAGNLWAVFSNQIPTEMIVRSGGRVAVGADRLGGRCRRAAAPRPRDR